MEREQKGMEIAHVLVLPLPVQGHINPMLQFSKRLASKGLKVTLVTTNSVSISMHSQDSSVKIESISDGNEGEKTNDVVAYIERFKTVFPQSLNKLIEKLKSSGSPPKFLIYDSVIPWILQIAREFGIDGAPLFTQSWAVTSIYYHVHQGTLKFPPERPIISLPSMPSLEINDLPSFLHQTNSYPALIELVVGKFSRIEEPKWLFCNTFDKLEDEVLKWMASKYPIKPIGPTIPSTYLDKRLENDKDYGLSLFKPNTDTCMTWLDAREIGSVVYISFGSLATLGEEQMQELAWGLKRSNSYFVWVVRESEVQKLPSNFYEETSEKGLVVNWSPQLEVLAHKSVGCFVTHCGWNSTLEAISLGVPMVAMPQWTDQTTNAKFVADVWEVGVRVRANEKGFVTREEIELCIREIMEGERGKDIRRNCERWKESAKEAVDDGGSSDKNIEEFVAELICN